MGNKEMGRYSGGLGCLYGMGPEAINKLPAIICRHLGRSSGRIDGTGGSIEGLPFDTALIKGSTPLSEVVNASGIPASVFTQVYGVPEGEMDRALKDLKTEYGCSPGEVRAFIEAYVADPTVADTWEVGAFEEEGHE